MGIPHGPRQHRRHRFGNGDIPIDEGDFGYGDHHHDNHDITENADDLNIYKPLRCYKEIGANGYLNIIATIICPPLGIFMAYGISGWFKILICCFLTLFYYIPGLFYSFLITTHLGIGDDLQMKDCGGRAAGFIVKGCETRYTESHCNRGFIPNKFDKNGKPISACRWVKENNERENVIFIFDKAFIEN